MSPSEILVRGYCALIAVGVLYGLIESVRHCAPKCYAFGFTLLGVLALYCVVNGELPSDCALIAVGALYGLIESIRRGAPKRYAFGLTLLGVLALSGAVNGDLRAQMLSDFGRALAEGFFRSVGG